MDEQPKPDCDDGTDGSRQRLGGVELRMNKGGRPPERFCKRGHDTHEVGRIRKGWCKACAQAADAAGGVMGSKHPKRHPIAWERARVKGWLEIAADDPIPTATGSVARLREFQVRYKRLEADVPTPVDA